MQTFPVLLDLGLVISAATIVLLLGRRVPQILSYMVAGLVLGPATGLLEPAQSVELLSELGVALLLFLVGLELSLARIRDVGGSALGVGLAQVAVTAVLGAALAWALGFERADALVLGLALTFSSTVVVVKLLDRIGGVGSVAGRTTVGVLLVQDLVVAAALTAVAGVGGRGTGIGPLLMGLARAGGGMIALALLAVAAVRWVLPRLFAWIAPSAETLLVVSLTWCFAFIVGAELIGVSIELGAFIAGLALAQLPYSDELVRRVHPLADFFLAVFFVALGARMEPGSVVELWPLVLALSGFVLLVKPTLVTWLLLRRRYHARTAFVSGLALGQVSEFGFVFVAVALASGVAGSDVLAPLLGLVGLVTIAASALLVPHAPGIYERLAGILPRGGPTEPPPPPPLEGHVVVVGMNTLGRMLVRRLDERGHMVVAIDNDPKKLDGLPARTVFGNADSRAVLGRAGIERAHLVVATPQIEDVNALIAYRCNRAGVPVSVQAFDPAFMDEMIEIGADHLMMPKLDGIRLVEQELLRLGVLG